MILKLTLSYNGHNFLGSATQPHKNSVQDHLQKALAHLGIFNRPLFASRTDKGVHALAAVASIECEHFKDLKYLENQINRFSKPNIFIKKIEEPSSAFNVRFDAKSREYLYIFYHAQFSPFLDPFVHFYPTLDKQRVNQLLQHFLGKKDFKYFCKSANHKNTVRTILYAHAHTYKNYTIFKIRADGFLRSQIRMMVDGILKVLEGKISEEQLKKQIDLEGIFTRSLAPAKALYLNRIIY